MIRDTYYMIYIITLSAITPLLLILLEAAAIIIIAMPSDAIIDIIIDISLRLLRHYATHAFVHIRYFIIIDTLLHAIFRCLLFFTIHAMLLKLHLLCIIFTLND